MIDPYESIKIKPELNKKRVFLVILPLLIIIALGIYSGIRAAQYENEIQKEKLAQAQKEQQIAEQKRIEQVKKEAEQKEKENLEKEARIQINTNQFTQEQIQTIEKIYNSQDGEKRVFLTFDDGPTQTVTPLILDLLKKENIKATFFVLGNRVKANPDLIKREFEEGHYIANHGYTHKYSQIYQKAQNVVDEYNYTEQAIQEALNNPNYHSNVFRFPGGSNGGTYHTLKQEAKKVLKQNNIAYLDWNCLSKDAEGANTKEKLLQNVIDTAGSKKSLVILMHDAADKILTYETLPEVISYLRQNGYIFKNLYDIL